MRKLMIVSLALSACFLTFSANAGQVRTVEKSFRAASGEKLVIDLKTGGSVAIRG